MENGGTVVPPWNFQKNFMTMTEKKRREIYVLALELWGIQAQKFMVIEEVGEMLNALAKANRGRSTNEEIITELADVSIMVEQMAQLFGWNEYHRERARKLNRLRERLNKDLAKRGLVKREEHSCYDCQHWQDGDEGPQCEYPDMPPCDY